MQRTERTKQWSADGLRTLPVVLSVLLVVVAIVDLLIAAQPPFLRALEGVLRRFAAISGVSATWSSVTAAAISLAGLALAASLSLAFIRAFQQAPYVGLAPPLIGFAAWVMGSIPVALPLHVTPQIFAGFTAFLVFAGGGMLCATAFAHRLVGMCLLGTPLFVLTMSYLLSTDVEHFPFDQHAQLVFLMLLVATVGTTLIALVWPRGLTAIAGLESARLHELSEQARTHEARAAEAERRLASLQSDAEMVAAVIAEDDEDIDALRRKPGQGTLVWAGVAAVVGLFFAGVVFEYLPVRRELHAARDAHHRLAERESAKHTAQRTQWLEERTALERRLAEAELTLSRLPSAMIPSQTPLAEPQAPTAAHVQKPEPTAEHTHAAQPAAAAPPPAAAKASAAPAAKSPAPATTKSSANAASTTPANATSTAPAKANAASTAPASAPAPAASNAPAKSSANAPANANAASKSIAPAASTAPASAPAPAASNAPAPATTKAPSSTSTQARSIAGTTSPDAAPKAPEQPTTRRFPPFETLVPAPKPKLGASVVPARAKAPEPPPHMPPPPASALAPTPTPKAPAPTRTATPSSQKPPPSAAPAKKPAADSGPHDEFPVDLNSNDPLEGM
jgi:hypothetical protein